MTPSLFQLGAQAWLNPQIVGHAIQGTRNSQFAKLVDWSQHLHLPDIMREAEFDSKRITRGERLIQNLNSAVESGDYRKACRAKEKVARLTLGLRNDGDKIKWQRVAWHGFWVGGGDIRTFVSASPVFPVEYYRANPIVTVSSDELSFAQEMAILAVVEELYEQILGNRVESPLSWETLERNLHFESAVAQALDLPVDLRVLAEHTRVERESFFLRENYPPRTPYTILGRFMGEKQALIGRVGKLVFQRSRAQLTSFGQNILDSSTEEELAAAVELFEAGFSLEGDLFLKYTSTPDRRSRLEEAREIRARELAQGETLGDMTDPFEVIAAFPVFGRTPFLFTALDIVRKTEIPNRSEGVYYRPFTFSVRLVKPFYDVANKGTLEKLKHLTLEGRPIAGLKRVVLNFEGSRSAYQRIAHLLQGVSKLKEEGPSEESVFDRYREIETSMRIVQNILIALKSWVDERTDELIRSDIRLDFEEVEARVCREIEKYVLKLLIILTRWRKPVEELAQALSRFGKEHATEEETYVVLDRLSEFYNVYLPETEQGLLAGVFPLGSRFSSLPSLDAVRKKLEAMNENKQQAIGEIVEIVLVPGTGKLDVFYGYMSENCLAKPEWAVHAMSDPDFVPYRMVVGGKWRGVVQTFTKNVTIGGEKKKILIVTGVDPQLNLTPSPEEFLRGLEKGFWEIAREGGYDLVVVPALEFAQSSRRALLRTAFKRYREEVEIDAPVSFPKIGENSDGSPKYYNDVEHRKFLVFHV